MASRRKTSRRRDKKIWKATVQKTKAINVRPMLMRGGYRM